MIRRRWPMIVSLGLLGLLVATGCAADAPLDTMEPRGFFSEKIDGLFNSIMIIAGIVFVLVQGGVLFLAMKFRHKGEYKEDDFPAQVHGNFPLEMGWTIAPAILLAIITVPTITTLFVLTDTPETEFQDCITVAGQQWWWSFEYDVGCEAAAAVDEAEEALDAAKSARSELDEDDNAYEAADEAVVEAVAAVAEAKASPPDIATGTELVIPAGHKIQMNITSRDVIHSFWIPALNGKRDAVPTRVTQWNIHANEPGIYLGQCTEFCGLSHGVMRMHVKAVSDGDYETWKADQLAPAAVPTDEVALAGREIFAAQCASCHTVREDGGTGSSAPTYDEVYAAREENPVPLVSGMAPDLTHFASRDWFLAGLEELYIDGDRDQFNRVDLEQWLRDPVSIKEMAPDPVAVPGSEIPLGRGMPNLNLSESQIDELVAYLEGLE